MTPKQIAAKAAADLLASQTANTAPEAPVATKVVTLKNATTAQEVLQSVIAIMKSKVHIATDQLERTLIFRVVSDGNLITRANGQVVMLYNTNATSAQLIAKAMGLIAVDEFLAFDVETAREEAKAILNACSLSFSAPVDVAISKNDEIKAKPHTFENKDGEQTLGLNFVGIQQAGVAVKGDTSALDALLATLSA